jgi:hypothetical protein
MKKIKKAFSVFLLALYVTTSFFVLFAHFFTPNVRAQSQPGDAPDIKVYIKTTRLADNQIQVDFAKPMVISPDGKNFSISNESTTHGVFTDADPFDTNHNFTSGKDVCGGLVLGGRSQEAHQSEVLESNGHWRINLWVDTNVEDNGSGCVVVSGDIDTPAGNEDEIDGNADWVDRTRLKYKGAVYTIYRCNPWNFGHSFSDPGRNAVLNLANVSDAATMWRDTASGEENVYEGGNGNSNRAIANVMDYNGTFHAKTEGGKKFVNLDIHADGDRNGAITGYKLDKDNLFLPCGLKFDTTLALPELNGVDKALYHKFADTDPQVQGSDKVGRYFRVEGGNTYWQDWIDPLTGKTSTVHTTNNAGGEYHFGVTFACDGNDCTPPEDVYGKKEDLVKAANSGNPSPDGSSNNADKLDCQVSLANPLTWLMCPIIEAANTAVLTLDRAITSQLTIDTSSDISLYNQDKDSGKQLFTAWASFRYIALGILVIVGLVMIISQALSFGVFDAYTIKKILPRILIGVIGISISWYLCKFAIEVANDLGVGVRSLLYGPFQGLNNATIDQRVVSLLGVGGGVAVIGLGVVGILSFMLTALLAVIIAFAILVFRQILILLLVITAPVAIACWILPNTEKAWKLWWDFFSRALIVFPIISLFIAGGRVIAQLATTTAPGQSPSFLNSCIAFIAYFGPYFALPAAFRLAGGAIATIGGLANDRSRGVFDRLKKGRQERMSKNFAKASSGKRVNENFGRFQYRDRKGRVRSTSVGKWVNRAAGAAITPHEYAGYYGGHKAGIPFLKSSGAKLASQIDKAATEQTIKLSQEMQAAQMNDKALKATSGQFHNLQAATQARLAASGVTGPLQTVSDFQKAAKALRASDDVTEQLAADSLDRMAGRLGTVNHDDPEMAYASVAGAALMEQARQGFASGEDIAYVANNIGGETGDMVAKQASLMGQGQRSDVKFGYGVLKGEDGKWQSLFEKQADGTYTTTNKQRAKDLFGSIKQQDWLGNKSGAVKTQAAEILSIANEQVEDADGNLQFTEQAKAAQEIVMLGASQFSSSDADAKIVWKDIASKIPGLSDRIHATDAVRMQAEAAGTGDAPDAGGAAPGTPTPTT